MTTWSQARSILAVRLDNIGDVIMLGPALRAVKEALPQARITLLASPAGASAAPLLPWIDDVIVWRALWQQLQPVPCAPQREYELIATLAERRCDAALIFTSFSQTPHVPGYVCYLAGIPLRAGESKEFGGQVLTTEVHGAPDELHQVERNLRLVETLGFVVRDRRLAVHIDARARRVAEQLLRQRGINPDAPFVLVHPGASAAARRYPPERMAGVLRLLSARGWPVLVTGVERERDLLLSLAAAAPAARLVIGATSLMEYAALIERAALVICGNTLPLHLADALMTPVLALYSGTDYETQWQPRSTRYRLLRRATSCHPCYRFTCPIGLPCLAFTPDEVVSAAEELLTTTSALEPSA